MCVKKSEDVNTEQVNAGKHTTRQILIGPETAPNFSMRRFRIAPGGSMPSHTNRVEHEQYVLGGRARVGIGNKVHDVCKDDVLFIPAGITHWYETVGSEDFEFLCIVPNSEDEIKLTGDG